VLNFTMTWLTVTRIGEKYLRRVERFTTDWTRRRGPDFGGESKRCHWQEIQEMLFALTNTTSDWGWITLDWYNSYYKSVLFVIRSGIIRINIRLGVSRVRQKLATFHRGITC
jgi:hypothetical protein